MLSPYAPPTTCTPQDIPSSSTSALQPKPTTIIANYLYDLKTTPLQNCTFPYTIPTHSYIFLPPSFPLQQQNNPTPIHPTKMQQDYSSWQVVKPIDYNNPLSSICIRSKHNSFIVQKVIKISQRNQHYANMELQIMQEIDSPHVVKCLGHKYTEKSISIFMPFYQQGDLEDYLWKNRSLDFKTKMNMFIDILVGLKQLHSKLIIHRDLKLKNIFVQEGGKCVVGDIGIPAVFEGNMTSQVGTAGNQAPDVYSNKNYDQKVDVWTMGIIAYQLFNPVEADQLPYPFYSQKILRRSIRVNGGGIDYQRYLKYTSKIKPFDPTVPQDLVKLIYKMLQNKPEERISWVQIYTSGILDKYDEQMRLCSFKGEYKKVVATKERLRRYDQKLRENHEKYFQPLFRLLSQTQIQNTMKTYPFLQPRKHDLHIFLFLSLRRALEHYQFFKENRVFTLVAQFKPWVKKYKEVKYNTEHRINIWLRDRGSEQIANNQKLQNSAYFEKLKGMVDDLLLQVKQTKSKY